MQFSFFFMLPNILLSGYIFPRVAMPLPAQWIGLLLPLTYYLDVLRGDPAQGDRDRAALAADAGADACSPLVIFADQRAAVLEDDRIAPRRRAAAPGRGRHESRRSRQRDALALEPRIELEQDRLAHVQRLRVARWNQDRRLDVESARTPRR